MSITPSGAVGRSGSRRQGCHSSLPKAELRLPSVLTCLQVPEVLAAHLVVPALAVAVAAAPNVQPGADGGRAVAGSGSGPAGGQVVRLRALVLVLQLGLEVFLLLRADALPAHRVLGRKNTGNGYRANLRLGC